MVEKSYSFVNNDIEYEVYTLSNSNGIQVDILNYGARIIRIMAPDKDGNFDDIVVGCKCPEDYLGDNPYFGATVGRVCNRIEGARFTLNGIKYDIDKNEGENTLHGGFNGFERKFFDCTALSNQLIMYAFSADGECGFPGNLKLIVTYTLTDDNKLIIEYGAKSDKDTVCNITNHTYFNLGGTKMETVLGHELKIKADYITPSDENLIPTGEILKITDTAFDFNTAKPIGKDLLNHDLLKMCNGYDHNYCLNKTKPGALEYCATLYEPTTHRQMKMYTTQNGLQIYTGNGLDYKGKRKYIPHASVCLEAQGYPNAVNCPNFPSVQLKKGDFYKQIIVWKFGVRD